MYAILSKFQNEKSTVFKLLKNLLAIRDLRTPRTPHDRSPATIKFQLLLLLCIELGHD